MGYTRQLGQLAYLITFDGSGNITVPASLTQGSVTSSILKADVGGKLVAAVAGTDFVAPAGLSAYVPTTRTITINGTTYDLSADRSWSIVSGVSSFNTRTGAITLTSGDVTGALGYTPVTNARTITINGTTYDLSADRTWTISSGVSGTANYIPVFSGSTTIGNSNIYKSGALIGINTTSPNSPLHVYNSASTGDTTAAIALDTVIANNAVDIRFGSSNPVAIRIYASSSALTSSPSGAGFQAFSNASASFPGQIYFDSGAHNSAALIFRTAQGSGTITTRMRIESSGTIKLSSYTSNGFVKTSNSDGTITIDTTAYTPTSRTITINGTTYDLSANRSWSIVAGISSFNTRTGDITLLDTDVTGALGYTPVTNARTITINGTTFDLSANRTWVVDTSSVTTRVIQKFTATSSQTTFTITGGYTVGMVDVFLNGIKLDNATEFTASNGSTVVLAAGAATGDIVEVYKYGGQFIANNTLRQSTLFTATAGQTTFTVNYSVGFVDVFYNGSKLDSSEFTATNGTSIVLGTACVLNDKVEVVAYNYTVGAFTGVGGSGTTNYVPKWTASGTLGNSLIFDDGTNVGIGTSSPSASLDIYLSSIGTYFRGGSNNAARQLRIFSSTTTNAGDTHNFDAQSETGNLVFQTTSTERMRITSSGNVGIGTTTPALTNSTRTTLDIGNASQSLLVLSTGGTWRSYFYNDGTNLSIANSGGFINFDVLGERMRITNNGNVGIGTSAPATKLVVIGGTLNSGSSTNNYTLALQDPTSMAAGVGGSLLFQGYKAGTSNIGNYAYVAGKKENGTSGNEAGYLSFGTFDSAGNPSEKIRVTSAGQILTSSQPAFMAYGNGDNFNALSGSYLWYPTVQFNRGNHYNASNGVFTAPIAGIYYFSWSDIGGDVNDVYRFYIRVNNSNYLGDYHLRLDTGATGAEYGTNGNRCAMINLAANDTVRIFFRTDNTNTFYGMGQTANSYHNFMGYLIG